LLWLIRIKQLLRKSHVRSVVAGPERTALDAGGEAKLSPTKTLALVQKEPKTYGVTPDSKIVLKRPFQSAQQLFHDVQKLLSQVAEQ
jgi:transcription-repair coupling factor (superfamily II helicase)